MIHTVMSMPFETATSVAVLQVFCVDDNQWIGESVMRLLRRAPEFAWGGWFASFEGLLEELTAIGPPHRAAVLLDVDIPGCDSFEFVRHLSEHLPEIRVLMLSGHVQVELIDRAIEAGAWGYVSKNEETSAIVDALRLVVSGQVAFSPGVLDQYQRR